jgi:hypothetical protein
VSLRRLFSLTGLLGLAVACAPNGSAVVTEALPTEVGFPYVAELMVHRCGTLDCHGVTARNLRVYGDEGLRFASTDRPCVPVETTTAEVGQDYASIIGLEPEEMNSVVANHGADPEQLSLIAKPLGIEEHMGGTIFQQGDDTYVCLTSWLSGETNTTACLSAMPATICGVPATVALGADAGVVDAGAD